MGATYELSATAREKVGKGAARSVRRQGMVPAVIYGGNQPPTPISLNDRDIRARIAGGGFYTTVATIAVNGEKVAALPRDYQLDPVTDRPIHVDFLRILPGTRVSVDVPVTFVNEGAAPGIKRGGVLNVVRHRVSLLCPVDAIPDKIVGDLAGLDIGDSLHISAIRLPERVQTTIKGRDFTIATVAAAAGVKEEIKAALEAATAAKAAAEAAEAVEGAAPAAPAEGAAPAAAAGTVKPEAGKRE